MNNTSTISNISPEIFTIQNAPEKFGTGPLIYHSCQVKSAWKEIRGSLITNRYLLEIKGINRDSQTFETRLLSFLTQILPKNSTNYYSMKKLKASKPGPYKTRTLLLLKEKNWPNMKFSFTFTLVKSPKNTFSTDMVTLILQV